MTPTLHRDDAGQAYATGQVPGHALRLRGEGYLAVDCYRDRCSTNVGHTTRQHNTPTVDSVRGEGHAVCQCGVLSPHVATGADRKRWHRAHKARVLMGDPEPPGQPTPVDPQAVA